MKCFFKLCLFLFISIELTYAQSPPQTINDSYSTDIDTPITINATDGLLQNDTDADGDALNVIAFIVNGVEYTAGQSIPTIGGNVTINADGSIAYNPSLGFTGSVPVIVYIVSDGTFSSYGNLNLTITSIGPPDAQNDFDTADINTTLTVPAPGVLSNDTFEDENTITITSYTLNGITFNAGQTANTGVGSFTLFDDGSFIFVPAAGYTGDVPPITYTISDGIDTSTASLFLTVEDPENLIQLIDLSSCNQGFTTDGNYKIRYTFGIRNLSTARDYHTPTIINTIEVLKELDNIYGAGCIIAVDEFNINSPTVDDFIDNPYPIDFDNDAINPDFENGLSSSVFTNFSVENSVLYPRQRINISFCLIVDPFCDGRPNPTPSGSGVNFEPTLELTSSAGDFDSTLLLEDFHTTESIITAGFFIPENSPPVNPDGTFDYINSIILTNDGSSVANNVNFNMGLGNFLDNTLTFSTLTVTQVSGPPVNVNTNYDGDASPLLLLPNNSLAPGESIVLEIFHLLDPIGFTGDNNFPQVSPSQTQGILDGFDESTPDNSRLYSFALWEDNLGSHLDRYYSINSQSASPVNDQCNCSSNRMSFEFISSASGDKAITNIDSAPDGIIEYEEITFQLTVTNTSPVVELTNLVLQDDLSAICDVDPISFTAPEIVSSSATIDPNLNTNYDGITDINIFDGSSGILGAGESITVEITIVFSEDCVGENTLIFSGIDPVGTIVSATANIGVDTSTDNDNDGISNINDIDDDNDTILDVEESNGADPLDDHDGDFVPNYRDIDFGPDANNDGIVDSFDFDSDGVPNHFDLDADSDGIFDIQEVNNQDQDTDNDGLTNNPVGINGLDNTLETDDSFAAAVTYVIPNTDNETEPDYLDIDADADGIVDNIEAQPTDNYLSPDTAVDDDGRNLAYLQGLIPVDTDGDGVFDYIDINSDDDVRDDFIEGWDFDSDGTPETTATGTDADNDGLDDAFDNDVTQINPTNAQIPLDFPNVDYDVTVERDWREIMAVVVLLNDVSTEEGNDLTFTFSLVRFIDNNIPIESGSPIDITLITTDGADTAGAFNIAVSPFDYDAVSNFVFVIPAFTTTSDFSVTSLDDNISELDELFTLNGNVTSGNTVNTETEGIGTILDNEPLPTVTMNDDIVNEGEDLIYNINLDIPSSSPVEINLVSLDNTAVSPDDYTPINITVIIESTTDPSIPNLDGGNFNITTLVDNLNEPDSEVMMVLGNVISNNVSNPSYSNTGTILDIDPNPLVVISSDEVVERNTLSFTITLLNAEGLPMGNYLPIDFDLETIDITTTVNLDYPFYSQFDFIPAGGSSLTIQIPTFNDNLNEVNEYMNLSATIISGDVANNSNVLLGLGTIIDNDIPNLFTPNNDGQSDVFRIGNLENYPNFKLVIFDRWGGEIYNYNNNGSLSPLWWDGTRNGNPVIEGVYFYELDYNDGVTKPKAGFIQLAR
jgi:gliding motility-associated-like protein